MVNLDGVRYYFEKVPEGASNNPLEVIRLVKEVSSERYFVKYFTQDEARDIMNNIIAVFWEI